jgi:hypothetical protein
VHELLAKLVRKPDLPDFASDGARVVPTRSTDTGHPAVRRV